MSFSDILKVNNIGGEVSDIESLKYILVVINAILAIIVNSINLYTGNRKARIFGLVYLVIVLWNIYVFYKKIFIGSILD